MAKQMPQSPLSLFKEAERYDAAVERLETQILVFRDLAERTRDEAAALASKPNAHDHNR